MSYGRHDHSALTVVVQSAHELDGALSNAIGTLQERALESRCCGILVTRETPGQYTVALHESVPFGLTRERWA